MGWKSWKMMIIFSLKSKSFSTLVILGDFLLKCLPKVNTAMIIVWDRNSVLVTVLAESIGIFLKLFMGGNKVFFKNNLKVSSLEKYLVLDLRKMYREDCQIGWALFWKFWTNKKLIKPLKDICISMDHKTGFKLSVGQNQKICRPF